MKKYVHEKKNQLDTALFRTGKLQRSPELFGVILDEDGNPIDKNTITRKNELTGAGIQYVTSLVDYYCTHHKNDLVTIEGKAKRMKMPTLTWKMAIDIVTGGIMWQRERAEAAILNLMASQKPVFMYGMDGLSYLMIPFVIDLTFEDGEIATIASAAKLARLIKGKKPTRTTKKGEIIAVGKPDQKFRVVKYIDIQFALPLFEGFFIKETGIYSFPTGMYAKFYQNSHNFFVGGSGEVKNAIETEPYVDFYCKFARYIAVHNNTTGKTERTEIHISIEKMISEIYPKLIHWIDGKPILRDRKAALELIVNAIFNYHELKDFPFYPSVEGLTADDKYIFGLYKKSTDAIEAMRRSNFLFKCRQSISNLANSCSENQSPK